MKYKIVLNDQMNTEVIAEGKEIRIWEDKTFIYDDDIDEPNLSVPERNIFYIEKIKKDD